MKLNTIRRAIEERGQAIGTWVQMRNPEACEAAIAAGYDFVVIDAEHGSFWIDSIVEMVRAVDSQGGSAIVRVPDHARSGILKVLDAGALGVMVPGVKTGEEAIDIARAVRYEPKGCRGSCPMVRATAHAVSDWREHRRWSDENILAWAIVEKTEAIKNIEAIVSSGIDGIVLGPFDLSVAMGLDGDIGHPEVVGALKRACEVARARDIEVVYACFGFDPKEILASAREWKACGARILLAMSDRQCLSTTYMRILKELRTL